MTIHLPQNNSVPELRRVLELIQKQSVQQLDATVKTITSSSSSSGISSVSVGPKGDTGPAGADGIANLDDIVISFTESEDIVMHNGAVVTDSHGFAVTDTHIDYDIVEDEDGFILTAE